MNVHKHNRGKRNVFPLEILLGGRRVRLTRTNLPVEARVPTDRSMVAALLAYNSPIGT